MVHPKVVKSSEGKSSLGGSSKYSMFVYFPKFSYIPLRLRFILALCNSPKIHSAMFTEDGNIGGNGNMFLGNFRGLQTWIFNDLDMAIMHVDTIKKYIAFKWPHRHWKGSYRGLTVEDFQGFMPDSDILKMRWWRCKAKAFLLHLWS